MTRLSAFGVLALSGLIVLTGCFGPPVAVPTSDPADPTPTVSSSVTTASPPAPGTPSAAPTSTAAVPPSSTPASPSETAEPTPAGLPEQVAPLTIYYVAVDDNGVSGPLIGCGDSLIATTTAPVRFTDQVGPSMETLLANKSRDVGMSGLVNVLYQSSLTYVGGELNGNTITIWLTGQFMLGGVCDIPRAKAQLEYTAMAAAGATSARVFVNNRLIDEVLSLR
ncbi:hypothetical protein [Arthrobacter sp. Bz4]|uniref:hypothetical protein n=1 Tax=Arthrobacter sp. Bz4 TaxID=2171979 RepID=UPI001FB049FA|nr:hypothetical protein [Arthrobacter sp. Bz4]